MADTSTMVKRYAGDDWEIGFIYRDKSGVPANLSNYSVSAAFQLDPTVPEYVVNKDNGAKILDQSISANIGRFVYEIPGTQTSKFGFTGDSTYNKYSSLQEFTIRMRIYLHKDGKRKTLGDHIFLYKR